MSRDEALEFLKPYLGTLNEAIVAGWKAWETFGAVAPKLRLPLTSRTRAGFVYDHIVDNARALFANAPGVRLSDNRGFLLLNIGQFLLRFKKLDKEGRSRQILTRQAAEWLSIQVELPHMPPAAVKLIAGYQLDLLGTEIQQVLVTRPADAGRRVEWKFSIAEMPAMGVVASMPATQVAEPQPAKVRASTEKKKNTQPEQ